jgi:hypothetical protein
MGQVEVKTEAKVEVETETDRYRSQVVYPWKCIFEESDDEHRTRKRVRACEKIE